MGQLKDRRAVIGNADGKQKSLYIYGTGAFDGNAAWHDACDKKCWSNWAGTDYNPLKNNCNTFTSTILYSVYGLSQKKPHLGVSDMVTVHGHCPSNEKTELITRSFCHGGSHYKCMDDCGGKRCAEGVR